MGKKLISLHTFGNKDGEIDNYFNDEIIIKKDSDIAVHSCCLELDNLKLKIDENSNKLSYRIDNNSTNAAERTIILTSDQYGQDNIPQLLLNIQNQFNQLLDIDTECSSEWNINLISDPEKKVNTLINMQLGTLKKYAAQVDAGGVTKNTDCYQFSNQILVHDAGAGLGNSLCSNVEQLPQHPMDQVAVGKIRLCKGSCQTGVTLKKPSPVNSLQTQSGFVLGWGNAGHDYVGHPVIKNHLRYYVRCPPTLGNTSYYHYKFKDGVEQTSTTQVLIGDRVQIELTNGFVRGCVYRLAAVAKEIIFIDRYPYFFGEGENQDEDLLSVLAIFGAKENMEVQGYYYHANPYTTVNSNQDLVVNSFTLTEDPPNYQDDISFVLTFQNINMANQFGYETLSIESQDQSGAGGHLPSQDNEARANYTFFKSHHGSNFKIEMLNLYIDSYDSLTGGLRNILCVIPVEDVFISKQQSRLNFQPENMVYLSIKNGQDISLRNIKCRVLDGLNNPVSLVEFSSINLLINDY